MSKEEMEGMSYSNIAMIRFSIILMEEKDVYKNYYAHKSLVVCT